MDFQFLRRGIIIATSLFVLTACSSVDIRPCYTVGVRDSTLNQVGIKINHRDRSYRCSGDMSSELLNPQLPYNDNSAEPNVDLPYGY